jgi:hypothetical protein
LPNPRSKKSWNPEIPTARTSNSGNCDIPNSAIYAMSNSNL